MERTSNFCRFLTCADPHVRRGTIDTALQMTYVRFHAVQLIWDQWVSRARWSVR